MGEFDNLLNQKVSRRKALKVALLTATGAGGLLAACQQATSSPTVVPATGATAAPAVPTTAAAVKPTAPAAAAAVPKVLRVGIQGDAVSLDAVLTNDNASMLAMGGFADHLVRPVPLGPELALSYTRTKPDVWLFKLRPNVKFHNGEDFTAEAVKTTIERYMDPAENAPNIAFIAGNIKQMNIIDPLTIEFIMKAPTFAFPADMTDLFPQPPKYVQQVGKKGYQDKPIGTGPYKFQQWVKGERFEYVRNEEWWNGKAAFEQLLIRPIPDANTRVSALLAKEVDLINTIPFERLKDIQNSADHKVLTMANERAIYCGIDTLNPPFNDKRVRQAMNYAVNWDAIVKNIFNDMVVRVTGGFSPVMLGDDKSITPYEYNLDKAKALMKEAGKESGFDTYIVVAPGIEGAANLGDVSQAMVADWAKINVRVKIDTTDAAGFSTRYHGTRRPGGGAIKGGMYYFTHSGITPGGRHLLPLFKSNTRGYYYQSQQADKLIDAYYASETEAELNKNGSALKALLKDDAPWVFMYQQPLLYGAAKSVQWQPNYGFYIPYGEIKWG